MDGFDLVINNGRVIDPEFDRDGVFHIGIRNRMITEVSSRPLDGKQSIDASGLVVAAGFIDIHTHEDDSIIFSETGFRDFLQPFETAKVLVKTGVTTMIGGNCGFSAYPLKQYLEKLHESGIPLNYGTLLGYNSIRSGLGIDFYESASSDEIHKLKDMVQEELSKAALGVSFGLQYSPGTTTEEVIEVAEIVKRFGKYIAVHMRYDYPEKALEAVEEMVTIARESGVSIEISHLAANVYGDDNILKALMLTKSAREEGLDITADVYPYDAWGTTIKSAVFDEGWLDHFIFSYPDIEIITGEYAGRRCSRDLFDILRSKDQDTFVVCHNAIPISDIRTALKDPTVSIMSDGQMARDPATGDLQGHPRSSGTPAKLLGEIVREKQWITLNEAIEKLTLLPAKRLKLSLRGRLQVGCYADITIFDPDTIIDTSAFGANVCASAPDGIEYVIIGGEIAYQGKELKRMDLGETIF